MRDVLILGAGGTGSDVLQWLQDINARTPSFRCLGFLDDDPIKWQTEIGGSPVLGSLSGAGQWPDAWFVNALGSPSSFRQRADLVADIPADRFLTLVHPSAHLSERVEVGIGAIFYPHVVVSPRARIGAHVTLLANVVINHDASIGDHSIVASGATVSGGVSVGASCYLGAGSHLIQSITVGKRSLIGMGAVVLQDVPEGSVVAGNPGRLLRSDGA